jgi:hypothetical protein
VTRARADFQSETAELVNLTGHLVVVYEGGQVVRRVPAEERGLRIGHRELGTDRISDDPVDVVAVAILPPTLPAPREGVWLIVSQVTALSLALAGVHRHDVVFPGPKVSNLGRIVGCRGLRWLITTPERAQ